ncbi:MAG: autotransporter outer membrane beta-barrel domain-containing protein, partial [Verrucomicrobiales bacterium]|nr:autotransporter outer membrane beta-barrel domain-containing protein [Verrucomicrobiales bacterium]
MKKTQKLTQWAALLLTVSGMAAQPVKATSLVFTNTTVTVSSTAYDDSTSVYALYSSGSGSFTGSNITVTATNSNHMGIYMSGVNKLNLTDSTVASWGLTIYTDETRNDNYAEITLDKVNLTAIGWYGIEVMGNSTLTYTGGTIRTLTASYGIGLVLGASSTATLTDVSIFTSGSRAPAVEVCLNSLLMLNRVQMECAGVGTGMASAALLAWGSGTVIGNEVTITSNNLGLSLSDQSSVTLNNSSVTTGTGAVAYVDNSELIINNGTLAGDNQLLDIGGNNSNVTLNNVETSGAGGIGSSVSGTGTVTVNGGSGVHGNITHSGSGNLIVNLNDSTMTGDIANQGDGTLTVILDNNSTGTGGISGGDLITGNDSVWTFDKDSHGNYGNNDGVWNIGDYDVTFDHLNNDGTININLNNDTGEGGSLTISDTASGTGTIHINATGNGQLNPNDVLPGIVSGDGTDHWQWNPIDWGIDTIIKDGDHFIKSGVSPAGAVLNSSVAIQQAMWFAQQNSLLKRMGDLRYGARASRPLAGETPAFHNLIENIWLRSYGQQLNVGSQVAGKAYEQLIYGVDLGTDHKFTISADSDLYLGIYAGYGRSDLDYRTPGTDGELNSYYGGLYATWLHSSGFYIDATIKAANVDNDLKAPYGTTQLTASYSDV